MDQEKISYREKRRAERLQEREKIRRENAERHRQEQNEKHSTTSQFVVPDTITELVNQGVKSSVYYSDDVEDVEELELRANEYIAACESTGYPIYRAGIALACGISEQELIDLGSRSAYRKVVSIINTRCSAYAQRMLYLAKNGATGPIFALKQYGWSDKQEQQRENGNAYSAKSEHELYADVFKRLRDAGLSDLADLFAKEFIPLRTEK